MPRYRGNCGRAAPDGGYLARYRNRHSFSTCHMHIRTHTFLDKIRVSEQKNAARSRRRGILYVFSCRTNLDRKYTHGYGLPLHNNATALR